MKRNIFLLLFSLLIIPLFCQEIHQYKAKFISMIPSGNNDGQIAYDKYGLPHHTKSFSISNDCNIYITDPYNSRITVFDINFNHLKNIKIQDITRMRIYFADKIILAENGNIIIVEHAVGIYKIGQSGKIIYYIKDDKLPDSVLRSDHFYPFDDYITFYNSEKELSLIDKDGNITTPLIVDQIFSITELKESKNIKENRMYNFIKANKLYYNNGRIFPKNYDDFLALRNEIIKDTKTSVNKELPEPDKFIIPHLLGYDTNNNIYWQGYWDNYSTRAIAVFSRELVLLDLFTYKPDDYTYIALAPDGDIYLMLPKPEGVYFYKIIRRW